MVITIYWDLNRWMSCAKSMALFFVHLLNTRFRQSATAKIAINPVVVIIQALITQTFQTKLTKRLVRLTQVNILLKNSENPRLKLIETVLLMISEW